jgi:Fic family protein
MAQPYEPKSLPLACIDWSAHVLLIGKANAALGRYDGMLQSIVNPAVLLSPLTNQEAVLSSRIEGTQASVEEVLEYEADPSEPIEPGKRADIQEILNYRQAMGQAVESLKKRPLCLNMVKGLHATLLNSVRGRNKALGELRRVQNFIGPAGCTVETATFVPPSVDRLDTATNNWEKYLHFEEKDRLVQLAVAKAQFELIHPFLDGNGRIGRMLVPLFLFEKGILSSPMFYVSAYLEEHREVYYARLQAVSEEDDWNGWIQFFLTAVSEQAQVNAGKTREILALYERMKTEVPQAIRSQYAIQAIDALFDRPIFTSTDFIARSKIPRDSALRILKALKDEGFIGDLRPKKGRRAAVLAFPDLIRITEGGR